MPGAVVVRTATQWTFAHEQGHVLGLNHVNDNNRLMTGNGTSNITNPPPNLVASEVATMQTSRLTADRKSTRLNSSHANISYAVFCLKKKKKHTDLVSREQEYI